MIWIFLMAATLAVVMYKLGGYIMIVSVVANLVKILLVLAGVGVAFWLVRRWWRGRRVREVPQIPPL